ncbi:hypothetical protein DQ04_03021040 [Trypanosoma grayi]|uniref:hypothetical protein n=1 Tax=Trypanosoma grayi TaxID=71804 RepID=UPI0004F4A7BC|nr:hypothetical protein DQ04_03021040 [Trypanosoma grayi]KEG11057.1 hypothetical protein DQ04_03021040 [Trypanosoma grayi]
MRCDVHPEMHTGPQPLRAQHRRLTVGQFQRLHAGWSQASPHSCCPNGTTPRATLGHTRTPRCRNNEKPKAKKKTISTKMEEQARTNGVKARGEHINIINIMPCASAIEKKCDSVSF